MGVPSMENDGFATSFSVDESTQAVYQQWVRVVRNNRRRDQGLSPIQAEGNVACSGKRAVWHVTDADLNSFNRTTEWIGADIIFDIERTRGTTELRFIHVGLAPAFECYGDCSGARGALVGVNLRNLIRTGENQPDVFA
jgi:hypothetical protein